MLDKSNIIINEAYIYNGETVIVADINDNVVTLYDGLEIPLEKFAKTAKVYRGTDDFSYDEYHQDDLDDIQLPNDFVPNIEVDSEGIPILKTDKNVINEPQQQTAATNHNIHKKPQTVTNPVVIMYEKAKNKSEMLFQVGIQIPMFNYDMVKMIKDTFDEEDIDDFVSFLVDKFVTIDNIKKTITENLKSNF